MFDSDAKDKQAVFDAAGYLKDSIMSLQDELPDMRNEFLWDEDVTPQEVCDAVDEVTRQVSAAIMRFMAKLGTSIKMGTERDHGC